MGLSTKLTQNNVQSSSRIHFCTIFKNISVTPENLSHTCEIAQFQILIKQSAVLKTMVIVLQQRWKEKMTFWMEATSQEKIPLQNVIKQPKSEDFVSLLFKMVDGALQVRQQSRRTLNMESRLLASLMVKVDRGPIKSITSISKKNTYSTFNPISFQFIQQSKCFMSAMRSQQGHEGLKNIVVQIIDVTVVRDLTFREGY